MAEPFPETWPLWIEEIMPGPDPWTGWRITGLGRTIDVAKSRFDLGLCLGGLQGIEIIAPGTAAKKMRVGPSHFFALAEEHTECATGGGKVVGATEWPAIQAHGDQRAKFAAQGAVATTIQIHDS